MKRPPGFADTAEVREADERRALVEELLWGGLDVRARARPLSAGARGPGGAHQRRPGMPPSAAGAAADVLPDDIVCLDGESSRRCWPATY
ncbi:hypothetical protein ACF1A5_08440 [Streptomyces sp. NPDC014864]|uniref:hypothetical protein n=1 Tax=Streptomyces sp. NPDC014864 TaxID=3364924 RepID=UPI0036F67539